MEEDLEKEDEVLDAEEGQEGQEKEPEELPGEEDVLEGEEAAGGIEEDIAAGAEPLETDEIADVFETLQTTEYAARDLQTVEEVLVCLHQDVHFIVNDFLPFGLAVLILSLGCYWFYRTFCR